MLSKPNRDLVERVCGPNVVRHEGSFRPHIHTLDRLLNAARSEPDERVKGLVEALERLIKPSPGVKKLPPWAVGIARAALDTFRRPVSE